MSETDAGVWGETFIDQAEAEFKARAVFGALTPETLDASTRGNGMIVHWKKGQGGIFTAATHANGLRALSTMTPKSSKSRKTFWMRVGTA